LNEHQTNQRPLKKDHLGLITSIKSAESENLTENKTIVNGYLFLNYIGGGAFGEVWLVKNLKSGTKYALKIQDKSFIAEKNLFRYVK
jgi:serine/threonine protein kinase